MQTVSYSQDFTCYFIYTACLKVLAPPDNQAGMRFSKIVAKNKGGLRGSNLFRHADVLFPRQLHGNEDTVCYVWSGTSVSSVLHRDSTSSAPLR